ncbi:hypothetical protein [Streptomyces sp. LN785]|uniref:hypothetical protein n=1 Tax=Streptomyces sp. LN785 TaxID=3112983 RepID=UPI00371125CB
MDHKGQPISVVIPGDRGHVFAIPRNRATMPPKISAAFDALEAAYKAEMDTKANDRKAKQAAVDATRAALNDLYDTAAATGVSRRQYHEEGYLYAASKLNRALEEADAALQLLLDHASQYVNPVGVGLAPDTRAKSVATLRLLAGQLTDRVAVPNIDD